MLARQLSRGSLAFEAPGGGLEALILSISLDSPGLARVMTRYQIDASPFPPAAVDRWRANGLRVASIPSAALESCLDALAPRGGTAQRQWLGQPTSWTELVRSGPQPPSTIALDGERLALPAGSLRLLIRAWTHPFDADPSAPSGRPRARLRLEILPQHVDRAGPLAGASAASSNRKLLSLGTPTLSAVDDGLLFNRMLLEGELDGSRALIIVFEQPDVDWTRLAATSDQSTPGEERFSPRSDRGRTAPITQSASPGPLQPGQVARGEHANSASSNAPGPAPNADVAGANPPRTYQSTVSVELQSAGPTGPELPSLGQAMLTQTTPSAPPAPRVSAGDREQSGAAGAPGSGADTARRVPGPPARRAVIVLVPKVPEHYSILPD